MDASAAAELTRLGGDPSGFVARQLTASMANDADLVLTATRDIRGQVVAVAPTALKRTFTLRELAALLEDPPWGDDAGDMTEVLARAADWRGSVSGLGRRPRRAGPDRQVRPTSTAPRPTWSTARRA